MIRVRSLSFSYRRHHPVLRDISFDLDQGGFILLAGANGSGKSTLLSILAGIHPPGQGGVLLPGEEIPASQRALRQQAGLLMQEADLQILGSTVAEDLMLGLEHNRDNTELCRETASRLGLLEWWDTPVHALSWGQKRKLCLAATLLRQPAVLLFDEPFSGLDYPSATELRRILVHNHTQGMTQVVAVHDLEPVLDLADRLLVLSRGTLALEGPPAKVLDHVEGHSVRPPCSWRLKRSLQGWG